VPFHSLLGMENSPRPGIREDNFSAAVHGRGPAVPGTGPSDHQSPSEEPAIEMTSLTDNATGTEVRPVEVDRVLDTLDAEPGHGLTSCPGRTTHELAAHLAGNYREITRHVDAQLAGHPLSRTRTFDEREGEFRLMDAPSLMAAIADGEEAMRRSLAALLAVDEDPVLRWTNRLVHATGFLKHTRSECAVHRWDIVGDDEVSTELLSPHELTAHLVGFLGATPITARGIATGAGTGRPLVARVRSEPHPDLLVRVHRGEPSFSLVPIEGDALVEGDPAARLLMLWGRRPTPFNRLRAAGPSDEVARLQWLLSGY
jgi:hypothetical protein